MASCFVEPTWLEAIRGTQFYYPAAGTDHIEPLDLLCDHVNSFMFCDTHYARGLDLSPVHEESDGLSLIEQIRCGVLTAEMENRSDQYGRPYRYLEPSKLVETYRHTNGREIVVTRRRGFGQIGLQKEFAPRSIGVFMHRGDSQAEFGSNVYFVANRRRDYEPCSNLFAKLGERLTDNAIVISDGSNTRIRFLLRFHRSATSSIDAYRELHNIPFHWGGFRWLCIGWMERRYGPTLVWGVERIIGEATRPKGVS